MCYFFLIKICVCYSFFVPLHAELDFRAQITKK